MASSLIVLLFAFFVVHGDAARMKESGTDACADIIPGSYARNRDKLTCKCKKGTFIVGEAEECAGLQGQRYFSPDTSLKAKCRCAKEVAAPADQSAPEPIMQKPDELPETNDVEGDTDQPTPDVETGDSDQAAPDVETVTETNVAVAAAEHLAPNVETDGASTDVDSLAPEAEGADVASDGDQLEPEGENNGEAVDDNELLLPVDVSDTPPVDVSDTPPVDVSDTPPVDVSDTPPVDVSDTPPVDVSDTMSGKGGVSGHDSTKIIILCSLLLLCVVGVLGGVCYYQLFPRNPALDGKDAVAPAGGGKLAIGGADSAPSRDVLAIHGAQS